MNVYVFLGKENILLEEEGKFLKAVKGVAGFVREIRFPYFYLRD